MAAIVVEFTNRKLFRFADPPEQRENEIIMSMRNIFEKEELFLCRLYEN